MSAGEHKTLIKLAVAVKRQSDVTPQAFDPRKQAPAGGLQPLSLSGLWSFLCFAARSDHVSKTAATPRIKAAVASYRIETGSMSLLCSTIRREIAVMAISRG